MSDNKEEYISANEMELETNYYYLNKCITKDDLSKFVSMNDLEKLNLYFFYPTNPIFSNKHQQLISSNNHLIKLYTDRIGFYKDSNLAYPYKDSNLAYPYKDNDESYISSFCRVYVDRKSRKNSPYDFMYSPEVYIDSLVMGILNKNYSIPLYSSKSIKIK